MKLARLQKRLQAAGYKVDRITLYSPEGTVPALDVDTSYTGWYPGEETYRKHEEIRKICGKRFRPEQRGHYTAVYITEA